MSKKEHRCDAYVDLGDITVTCHYAAHLDDYHSHWFGSGVHDSTAPRVTWFDTTAGAGRNGKLL